MGLIGEIFLSIFLFVVAIFGVMAILAVMSMKKLDKKQLEIENLLKQEKFNYTQIFTNDDINSGIIYDGDYAIGIFDFSNNKWSFEKIETHDILQSEIIEDGMTIMRVSRKDVLVGAGLFGVAGAIMGGIVGDKVNIEEVKKLQLQIVVNDTSSPIRKINFIDRGYPIKKSSQFYRRRYDKIKHWQKLIEVLIKNTEKQNETLKA